MRYWSVIVFLVLAVVTKVKADEVVPHTDSTSSVSLNENTINRIDSLCRNITGFSTAADFEIPYAFDADSIPVYPDSVYYERLEALNIMSPFDLRFNEEVRNYIIFFSSRRAGMISRALANKEYYFPLFEQLLDKYNLPQELKYLAVVESALNPNARSRAGAVGLWQFMPSTGRLYGLKYNSRIDERRDMWDATEAACRHFVDLYNIYHDWDLVLAAYNSGPGNVNRAVYRAGDSITAYWHIRQYLPRETRGYVPAFIAVNYLMNYPAEHNIKPAFSIDENIAALDTVYVDEKLYLSKIAAGADIPLATIKKLNPQYRKGYIPASKKHKYKLTLPAEAMPLFIKYRQEVISELAPDGKDKTSNVN